jgi:hypothetical protein
MLPETDADYAAGQASLDVQLWTVLRDDTGLVATPGRPRPRDRDNDECGGYEQINAHGYGICLDIDRWVRAYGEVLRSPGLLRSPEYRSDRRCPNLAHQETLTRLYHD